MPSCSARARLGIDLGGTKIEGVVLDASGAERARLRVASPRNEYDATLLAILDLKAALERLAGVEGLPLGLCIPGSISKRTGLVQNANSTWLNGRDLKGDLTRRAGVTVALANDANCFALSEATDGAGAGLPTVFGVILGTGTGGGIVRTGTLIDGPLGVGGEWGHNPLPWPDANEYPGRRCWCGRLGCMETWVSGPALSHDHAAACSNANTVAIPVEDIVAAAERGDAAAKAALDRHARRLARGLAHVVNILDPDVIVLGGGLSRLPHLYVDLPPLVCARIFADEPAIDIRPPKWGDASGVRGAAWLNA